MTTFFSLRLNGFEGESAGIETLYDLSGEENTEDDAADEEVNWTRLAYGGDEETGVSNWSLGRFNIGVKVRSGIGIHRNRDRDVHVHVTSHTSTKLKKRSIKACKNTIDIDLDNYTILA